MLLGRARAGDLVMSPPGPLPGLPLDRDHEIDLAEHAANSVGVGQFPRLVELAKAERTDGGLHVLGVADRALLPCGFDHVSTPTVPNSKRYPLPTLPARGREPSATPLCGKGAGGETGFPRIVFPTLPARGREPSCFPRTMSSPRGGRRGW